MAASILIGLGSAGSVFSEELSSESYRHQAGTFSSATAAGSGALTSSVSQPEYSQSEATVGGLISAAPVGSLATLRTVWPGFWAIVSGPFAGLDLDGDFAQFFLDEDDDGDGLDDVHETGTGFFVSATNTGTSPTRVDSDGDGFADGVEVAAGSDPNDPLSSPPPPGVPSLSLPLQLVLSVLLLLLGTSASAFLRRRPGC